MDCQHKNCTNSSNSVLQAMFELSFNRKEFFRILTASDFDAKIESDAKVCDFYDNLLVENIRYLEL